MFPSSQSDLKIKRNTDWKSLSSASHLTINISTDSSRGHSIFSKYVIKLVIHFILKQHTEHLKSHAHLR